MGSCLTANQSCLGGEMSSWGGGGVPVVYRRLMTVLVRFASVGPPLWPTLLNSLGVGWCLGAVFANYLHLCEGRFPSH